MRHRVGGHDRMRPRWTCTLITIAAERPRLQRSRNAAVYRSGSGQANLVAFKNLYVNPSRTGFCSGTAPTVSWAYNVSTGSSGINTSSILSLDGSKLAFVEDVSGGAVLHVLRWKSTEGSIGAPATPTTSTNNSST